MFLDGKTVYSIYRWINSIVCICHSSFSPKPCQQSLPSLPSLPPLKIFGTFGLFTPGIMILWYLSSDHTWPYLAVGRMTLNISKPRSQQLHTPTICPSQTRNPLLPLNGNFLVKIREIFQHSNKNDFSSPLQSMGFPGGASGKESAFKCWKSKRHRSDPWVGKIPWRKA